MPRPPSLPSFLPAVTLAAVICLGAPLSTKAARAQAPEIKAKNQSRAEVWIGGSRAWPDFIAPGNSAQWTFLQQNADGFYINNFALRLTDKTLKLDPTQKGRLGQLRSMRGLMRSPKAFYETDQQHATDAFDRDAVAMFGQAGFTLAGVTINRGTNPVRTVILTENGKLPLYYMFGPWRGGGDIVKPENGKLRAGILAASGAAVDGPVTMWGRNAGAMKSMCYSTIQWCHAHGKKFLYLLAPNESGADFLKESQTLAHDMEDNDANPDIWAVSFYGPPSFREKLETLPEKTADGRPAATFSGTAYWLIHHLRDPARAAHLELGRIANGNTAFTFRLVNRSSWLDLAPVVRARLMGNLASGWSLRWNLGKKDVTDAVMGKGLVFNRENRLLPGAQRELMLTVERSGAAPSAELTSLPVRIELLPHPSTPTPQQILTLRLTGKK